jgi:hypothetical protein
MGNNLQQVKQKVEYVLANYPETRNNDKKLQVRILKTFYGVDRIEDILRPDVPNLESIRRCRQKLQEDGKYKSSDEVAAAREDQQDVYREFAVTK